MGIFLSTLYIMLYSCTDVKGSDFKGPDSLLLLKQSISMKLNLPVIRGRLSFFFLTIKHNIYSECNNYLTVTILDGFWLISSYFIWQNFGDILDFPTPSPQHSPNPHILCGAQTTRTLFPPPSNKNQTVYQSWKNKGPCGIVHAALIFIAFSEMCSCRPKIFFLWNPLQPWQ